MRWLLVALTAAAALQIQASVPGPAGDYGVLADKGQRFFDNGEWASASAMYQLMLDKRPTVADTYAHAIVAEGMLRQRDQQMAFFNGALAHGIAFDSLLTCVRSVSFGCGATDLYEHFLLNVKSTHPWMLRVVDRYLLDYYSFRCDGAMIVEYSYKMLAGMPQSRDYLHMLARGWLLQGDCTKAVDTYQQIVEIYPDDYDSLLYIGNYYAQEENAELGLQWLRRAYELRATPYVAARISALEKL